MATGGHERLEDAVPAPDEELLERLPADEWAVLLRSVRAALHQLDDNVVTPRMAQLRALPASRLASGRSRRDLCRFLSTGGALWHGTLARLDDDPDGGTVLAILRGEVEVAAPQPRHPQRADAGSPDRHQRLRTRAREFREQRDDARRRAEGLEARLRVEQGRVQELEDDVRTLEETIEALQRRLTAAAEERHQAVERVRRQADAQVAQLRDELRKLRRREEERLQRRRRHRRAREALERRASEEIADYRSSLRSGARPAASGRPSRLPAGIAPGTVDAAQALLVPGRRVVVDGYNVSLQHRGHLELEQQRLWLTTQLESLVARLKVRCTVVFDGDPGVNAPTSRSRLVRVRFTAGGTADDAIVELVESLAADEPVVVVTDDRELADRVRRLRADVIGTAPLLALAG
ncbi:MAG: NYN domain-containing protein [Actinobacteria bacterium]|nr:NYN domain-containing protein [Actinomycetota bacterium]